MAKKQTDTGKAFEYCFATVYDEHLSGLGIRVELLKDGSFIKAQNSYNNTSAEGQALYREAALSTLEPILKLEPWLSNCATEIAPKSATEPHQLKFALASDEIKDDTLKISIAADSAGQRGDVRDVIFSYKKWQIGFSLKNNHDASKHSRLSPDIDFGKDWLGYACSARYSEEIKAVFAPIQRAKDIEDYAKWDDYPSKEMLVYVPALLAFKKEMERLNATEEHVPQKLLSYLLGKDSFYKVIKRDALNMVVIKGYNMEGVK